MLGETITLTRLREQAGHSRAELGRRARIHPAREGQIESGRVVPYDVELQRLAEALDFEGDPADLLQPIGRRATT
jgi:transcriptional regulator with XRE-family HTH domain